MRVIAILRGWTARSVLFLSLIAGGAFFGLPFSPVSSTNASSQAVAIVNAASFASDSTVAPATIVAAFGVFNTQNNALHIAATIPLPTSLGGVSIRVNGTLAALLVTSPGQINLVIPANAAIGQATVIVTNANGSTISGNCTIVQSQPGIFTATSNGTGIAAAQTTFDGISYEFVSNPNGSARDVNPGTKERPNILVLYVTGLGTVQLSQVTVTFLGVPGRVDYAGPQGTFAGLDQLNVRIPWELAGQELIRVLITIKIGQDPPRESNAVMIRLGGTIPDIVAAPIGPGQVINGELTYEDQVQTFGDNVFFFDAFAFTTVGTNTTVSIDLRSPKTGAGEGERRFDAAVLLYRLVNNRLELVAVDDQTGGLGAGDNDVNNNALLLYVIPQQGTYVILATSSDFEPFGVGTYTLELKQSPLQAIAYGASVNGQIASTDIKTSFGINLDAYWFNGVQGDRVEITMRSTAIDSFLILYRNETDPELAFDDNGFGPAPNRDAKLTFTLPQTGIYKIYATPLTIGPTGAYTLTLNKLSSFAPDGTVASHDQWVTPGRVIRNRSNPNLLAAPYADYRSSFERAALRKFVR